jgi:multidrug efflux system membrane fusion protein
MRRLATIAVVLLLSGTAAWIMYPPARQWPIISHVGNFIGAPNSDTAPANAPADKNGAKGRAPPAPVMIATATTAEMPIILSAPGTVEAFSTVDVKPRVDGQVAEVAFQEGEEVKAGDVLFRLDDRLIRAQMRQAEANIARDKASLSDAEAILKRRETLVTKNIVSEASTDTQRSAVEVLKASISAGQAQLEAWRTQLDYLTVLAPITGRTGVVKTKIGANVRAADTSSLVIINQTRPIAVTFAVPQVDLPTLRRALALRAEATIRVGGEQPISTAGKIIFIDNQVDKTTGTLLGKAEVANEKELLWPGQAVDVELVVEHRPGYVSVPASAVLPSQQGMLAWMLTEDGTVTPRTVTLARVIGTTAYLSGGMTAGERVVTDGQVRLAPGASVIIRQPGPGGSDTPKSKSGSGETPANSGKGDRGELGTAGPAARDTPSRRPGPERGRT